VWGDGMLDHWATVSKDGKWYVVTENTTMMNIIFVNGTDWNGDANQTVNKESITENTCFQLNQSGNQKATYTLVDCEVSTDVENIDSDVAQARKLLINGALYLIMPNGQVYDVYGNLIR
jgi:hypothetical protein